MSRKPDVIRALVVVFAVGLLISGITTLAASEGSPGDRAAEAAHLQLIMVHEASTL